MDGWSLVDIPHAHITEHGHDIFSISNIEWNTYTFYIRNARGKPNTQRFKCKQTKQIIRLM